MTLRTVTRVTLENWRNWQGETTFKDLPGGLVILAGPNALGKTGLWEAIVAGLLDRHWGTHTDRLRPAGTKGVLPRVLVEFTAGEKRYRVTKHFGGTRDRAEFSEFVGDDWVLLDQGEEAYLLCRRAVLGADEAAPNRGGPDKALKDTLMEVLLPAQGNLTAEAPAPEAVSAAVTDREAAGSATRVGRILTAVTREADTVWVGLRNRPKKGTPLADGQARLAEIEAELEPFAAQAERIGELVTRLVLASEMISGRDEAEARNAKAEALRSEVQDHRTRREAARDAAETARRELDGAETLHRERAERRKAEEEAAAALATARLKEKEAAEELRLGEVDHAEQVRRRDRIEGDLRRVHEWIEFENRGSELEHLNRAVKEVRQRIETATEAEQAAAKAEAELAALLVPSKAEWKENDELQQRLHEAEGRLKAGAWAVSGEVPGGLGLTVDGQAMETGPVDLEASREVVLTDPDGHSLAVTAPRAEAELVDAVRAEIRAFMDRFGVSDLAELRKRNDYVRSDLTQAAAVAKQRLLDALGTGTKTDLLRAEMDLDQRLRDCEGQGAPKTERPEGQVETWKVRRETLSADLEDARTRLEAAVGRLSSARERSNGAADSVRQAELALEIRAGALADHRRDQGTDEERKETLARLTALFEERQTAWGRLEEARPMAEEAKDAKARNLSAGLTGILEKQGEIQRLEAEIETLRREDPEGRLALLEAERAELAARVRSETTKADALLLLERSLTEEKDRVTQAIGEPVRERLQRLIRFLLQDDSEAVVDARGRPAVIRNPAGREVPFEDQSFGTREQVAILYRLAVADLVAAEAGSGVCLMLDDPFGHTDRVRRDRMLGILDAEAEKHGHQILIFTCRPEDFEGVGHPVALSRE
jgi:hypothetical protein